jgi:hypothetical protein
MDGAVDGDIEGVKTDCVNRRRSTERRRIASKSQRERARSRRLLPAVTSLCLLMIAGAYLFLASPSVAAAAPISGVMSQSSSTCNQQDLMNRAGLITSNISSGDAALLANRSYAYQSAVAGSPSSVREVFNSVAVVGNANLTRCSISNQSYEVAYSLVGKTSLVGQLSIWVSPSTGLVTNVEISHSVDSPKTSTGQWSGYETKAPAITGYTPSATYSSWTGFGVSSAESHCGATDFSGGVCAISFWGGLTAEGGGGNGIAQSGVNGVVECAGYVFGITCSSAYAGWYEFAPSNPNNCLSFSSPNDDLYSYVEYQGADSYYAIIWDLTSGNYCSGTASMSMGAPSYSQWMLESESNGVGGILDIPNFNFWFTSAISSGYPYPLSGYVASENDVPDVNFGPMDYNSGACSGDYYSCFQVYWT